MQLKQVWMSADTSRKSHHAQRTLGGLFGIMVLALALAGVGTWLTLHFHWPLQSALTILCLAITALVLFLALGLGRQAVRNATVFFLTENDRLYAMEARTLSNHSHGLTGYAAGALETQKFLREMAQRPFVPAGADEILRVEHIRETRTARIAVCRVRHPNRRLVRRTYFVMNGLEHEDQLLYQLERRQTVQISPELNDRRSLVSLLLSIFGFLCLAVLAALSHPALGHLPQGLYFPFLAAAFAALCLLVWFGVRYHREA